MFQRILTAVVFIFLTTISFSQTPEYSKLNVVDYSNPTEYEIGGVTVTGVQFIDPKVLISMSGFAVGRKITIPGDNITKVLEKFWNQGLFSDVKILIDKIEDNKVYLQIHLKERPRLTKFVMKGISKSDAEDLTEKLKVKPGVQVTDNLLNTINTVVKKHYAEKGFFNTEVKMVMKDDTVNKNRVYLTAEIEKHKKLKIIKIDFIGNEKYTDKRLRRTFKKTKQKDFNIFTGTKYIESKFKEDKKKLEDFYSKNGYRDFKILNDSLTYINDYEVVLHVRIREGKQYFIRNVTWVGNTIYPSEILNRVFKMKKGDVYDQVSMDKRLFSDEDAVNSLYLDNGYLFFNLTPVEVRIEGDSIDLEMRMTEGKQAYINDIRISGNTKTNEHVVRRELRTKPGELFSKSDIIRSVRELAQLGHFDAEKITPDVQPNPTEGNVDLHFKLVEKANDQLEVSGGWGAGMLVGTIGIRFSNFSARNILKAKEWRPVPSGDGQTLSLRAQSNGSYYRSYNFTFVEPWFGGKKPNSFSISAYFSKMTTGRSYYQIISGTGDASNDGWFKVSGVSVGLGKRLKWPDDWFMINYELSYQRYSLKNYYNSYFDFAGGNGSSNSFSLGTTIMRSSTDQPIYPRSGSDFSFNLQVTPPYSLFENTDYSSSSSRYKFIEYYKWKFKANTYTKLIGAGTHDLVLNLGAQVGYLGMYNSKKGNSPFEGFQLGGSGMTGYQMYGTDIVALRGYKDNSFNTVTANGHNLNIYVKYTMELRFPITLEQSAQIFALTFLEAGNGWYDRNKFNPFNVHRSAGVGIRAFLPMFGLLGIDWGYGFDSLKVPGGEEYGKGQFHFTIGQQF